MARGINKVMLLGHLGNDPEVRIEDDKSPLVTMSMGTSESWNDKDGNKQEKTTWHKVTLNGQPARFARDYLKKGDLVWVEGKNESRSYEKDGEKKYDYSVKGLRVESYGSKGGSESSGNQGTKDDIPF